MTSCTLNLPASRATPIGPRSRSAKLPAGVSRHPKRTVPASARGSKRACTVCQATPSSDPWLGLSARYDNRLAYCSPQQAAPVQTFDFIVVGSGIAGLTYALKVAEFGSVAVVTKASVNEGCTQYAQGGVCAVLGATDSVENHVRDTMVAGAFLNNASAVEVVCREGPERVLELVELGAEFTRNADGSLHLTREGGHSHRRIVHAADMTGAEIERALVAAAESNPNITLMPHHLAIDLLYDDVQGVRHCLGMDVLDQQSHHIMRLVAPVTMLATGGAGQVYPNTTNPSVTTGDGMAMAYRAKAMMANMEFVQFHPTSFYNPSAGRGRSFLISEAVRGEGGLLYNLSGERFMPQYDERAELAPRDVVARSIQDQMRMRGETHVLLDISHKPQRTILEHFPNIAATCAGAGIDITAQPIPVVPAQHYMCGGVQTGLYGETSVAGLYACGEVACTGLHGANRLASNSLLEGLVFAHRAVEKSVAHADQVLKYGGSALGYVQERTAGFRPACLLSPTTSQWVAAKRRELNDLMWSAAGIVRRTNDMKAALSKLARIYMETKALEESYGVNTELIELRNLVTVGELIMSSALQRKESRGLHYCADYPNLAEDQCRETVIATSLRKRLDLTKVTTGTLPLNGLNTIGQPVASIVPRRKERGAEKRTGRAREVQLRSQKEE